MDKAPRDKRDLDEQIVVEASKVSDEIGDVPLDPSLDPDERFSAVSYETFEDANDSGASDSAFADKLHGTDDLPGIGGDQRYFRPQRYKPEELHPIHVSLRVRHQGQTFDAPLQDISQNGVAFTVPDGVELGEDPNIERLTVYFDEVIGYRGAATINSIRRPGDVTVAGLSFAGKLIDMSDVLALRKVRATDIRLGGHLSFDAEGQRRRSARRFRQYVAELRTFFEDTDRDLREVEASIPEHLMADSADSITLAALIEGLKREWVPVFVDYSERIDEVVRNVDETEWLRLKGYSRRMLQDYMMRAPFLRRTHDKPLGYPGDYVVMQYLYERHFEGASLFGKALHMAVIHTLGARAVRKRKDLIKEELRRAIVARADRPGPIRIASIAAGPAQEVFELLGESPEPLHPDVRIVLFDQDAEALSFAQRRLTRLADARWGSALKLIYLHDSIGALIKNPQLFGNLGPFAVIFSTGLFDYLKDSTATRATSNFHANLAAGGSVFVGNMVPTNPCRWFLEHHLEWFLNYRTHERMLAFAEEAVPANARLEIIEDETGVNPFVHIVNP